VGVGWRASSTGAEVLAGGGVLWAEGVLKGATFGVRDSAASRGGEAALERVDHFWLVLPAAPAPPGHGGVRGG